MQPFHEYIHEYKRQLEHGAIQKAYRGLMEYMSSLRTYLQEKYPGYAISGSIYFGYMDMTYFAFSPQSFKQRNLKIAIVLVHEGLRFEAWLAGANKSVQAKYWKMLKDSSWDKYHLVANPKVTDSILETLLVSEPDFSDLARLTREIESRTNQFIADIEQFLASQSEESRGT